MEISSGLLTMSLEVRGKVRAGYINLGIIIISTAFKITMLDEIIWGMSKDREKVRGVSPGALQHLEMGDMMREPVKQMED